MYSQRDPVQRFRSWVEQQVAAANRPVKLPPDRTLAKAWGIGRSAVAKVLQNLATSGSMTRCRGRGTVIVARQPSIESAPVPLGAAGQLAGMLYEAMCQGEIRNDAPMPSVKFFCRRHRVSERTVIAALGMLVRRGAVTRIGKSYWAGTRNLVAGGDERRSAYVLMSSGDDARGVFCDECLGLAYHKMERELSRYGVALEFAPLREFPKLWREWCRLRRVPSYLVFHHLYPGPAMSEALDILARLAQAAAAPRVLCDWHGSGEYRCVTRNTTLLSRGNLNTSMARTIAKYLRERGAREAVLWYDQRAELPGSVWNYWALQKIAMEMYTLDPSFRWRQVITSRKSGEHAESFISRMCDRRPDIEAYLARKYSLPVPVDTLVSDITMDTGDTVHFAAARGCPVWLCFPDQRAADACEWARLNRVKVPQDLAILGFQNDPRFFHLGISSCVHDWERVGYIMAHALLDDVPLERTTKGFLRIDSPIVHRRTS